jgi:hypothetical protein
MAACGASCSVIIANVFGQGRVADCGDHSRVMAALMISTRCSISVLSVPEEVAAVVTSLCSETYQGW